MHARCVDTKQNNKKNQPEYKAKQKSSTLQTRNFPNSHVSSILKNTHCSLKSDRHTRKSVIQSTMDSEAARNSSSTVDASAPPRFAASGALGSNAILRAQEQLKTTTLKELARLQAERGWSRARAVRELLSRISTSFATPSHAEVRRVCDHFGLAEDDAMRAIFVKHELTRLNSAGLNTLAAIEVLNRRVSGGVHTANHAGSISDDQMVASSSSSISDGMSVSARAAAAGERKRGASDTDNSALRAFKRLKTMAMDDNIVEQEQGRAPQAPGQQHKREMTTPGFGVVSASSMVSVSESNSSSSINNTGSSSSGNSSAIASNKRDRLARADEGVAAGGSVDKRHSKRRR